MKEICMKDLPYNLQLSLWFANMFASGIAPAFIQTSLMSTASNASGHCQRNSCITKSSNGYNEIPPWLSTWHCSEIFLRWEIPLHDQYAFQTLANLTCPLTICLPWTFGWISQWVFVLTVKCVLHLLIFSPSVENWDHLTLKISISLMHAWCIG